MKLKKISIATLVLVISSPLIAAPSINDMQSCQGLLNFINVKLDSPPSNYDAEDIQKVRKGLEGYNQYIQREIVTPGLLKFNGGDQVKTSQMQQQVDDYKDTLVASLQKRYPQNRLFMDQAISVNNCAQKAVPSGQALEDLKESLNTIVKLAKLDE